MEIRNVALPKDGDRSQLNQVHAARTRKDNQTRRLARQKMREIHRQAIITKYGDDRKVYSKAGNGGGMRLAREKGVVEGIFMLVKSATKA
jgi:hypothetical protein